MEAAAAAAFGRPRSAVKTEKPVGDGDGDGDSPSKQHLLVKMGNNHGKQDHETEDHKTSSSSDDRKDLSCTKLQEDQLESARAEMGEVREENQRLKMSLSQIMKDYEALRMQFLGIVGRESNKLSKKADNDDQNQTDEIELVSLTLGRFPATTEKNKTKAAEEKLDQSNRSASQGREISIGEKFEEGIKESLSLGLNCKFERESTAIKEADSPNRSLTNSFDHEAKEEAGETSWPPSKGGKTMRSGDDDVAPQNPPKRARVCVRARCETATMNDGCQWRKYGQKIAKGNPCPRAYYRCTGSPTCPVRKQVQRCADDMSILITTYEGTHNHQLPVSATAMASTTSAAASMLLSGSSASSSSSSTTANLHGLNFYLSSNNNNPTNSKPNFYLPNNSSIISSTSPTHPTITLDLTSNNPSSSSNSSTHFGKFPSTTFANSRYPFTSQLDFGSSRNNVLSWNNGLLSYNNRNNHHSTTTNNIYQNYIQQQQQQQQQQRLNNHHNVVAASATSLPHQHQPLPDTIAAATKAITADPSFQSALAAALTSIIGTGGGTTAAANKGNGCGTSFLNNIAATAKTTTASNSAAGNMMFVPGSPLPFSNPKSASASPGDHIDLTN